ncbi:MAG: secretion protein HlyD [Rhizobacter sp.]|nr:secretion protein HlyD [Rhizobacter sp.]
MKRWTKVVAILVVVAVVAAVGLRTLKARKTQQAALASATPAPTAFDISPADLVTLRSRELVRTVAVSGGLRAINTAVIRARVAADVRELVVREGDAVKAGQVLVRLDPSEYEARQRQAVQNAASARSQLDIAQRSLDNNKALVEQGFISKTAVDTSAFSAAAARATLEAANAMADVARKALDDTTVRSPISGQISQRLVQPGERVGLDTKMMEIVDLSSLELEGAVPAEQVAEVRIGSVARLTVDGISTPVMAKVVRINPSTQAGTRAVLTYFSVAGAPGLRQGLFANGVIELERKRALVVPVSAVRVDQPLPYVLSVEGDVVRQRTVTLGARGEAATDAGRPEGVVEVLTGVPDGATLLRGTVGAMRDGTAVRMTGAVPAASSTPGSAAPAAPAASASASTVSLRRSPAGMTGAWVTTSHDATREHAVASQAGT